MPNTAQVIVNITDLSFSVAQIVKGIVFMQGITKRGPVADPSIIIRNFQQFKRYYGGLITNSDFPHLAKRALDKGTALRVSRVSHYTDVTDPSTLTALKASLGNVQIITFDAALITGNDYDLTVDGTPIATVSFNTDNDTTIDDIVTELIAQPTILNAWPIPATPTNVRSIVIIPTGATNVLTTGANNAGVVTGGASQAVADKDSVAGIVDEDGNLLFALPMKYEGADYNSLSMTIGTASGGNANAFKLSINHSTEPSLDEEYDNILISGTPTAADSHYLDDIITGSKFVNVTYGDLSGLTAPVRPYNATYQYAGGSDGSTVVVTDYTGDAVGTGLHAFSPYNDSMVVMAPELSDSTYNQAGATYAASRKDLQFFGHLANSNNTEALLIAARAATNIDTPYASIFAGGLKVVNPNSNIIEEISELGDVAALSARAENQVGAWRSFSGPELGKIDNVVGVVNNFGGNGQLSTLNALANRQINMVIDRDNISMLWDCYSAQQSYSKLSQNGVVRLIIFIEKSLRPTLNRYMQKPNDFVTWRQLYNEVKPFLDYLASEDARALFEYSWKGDQDKTSLDDLEVNNAADVGLGKYKVELYLNIVSALVELTLNITVTPSNVSLSVSNN